MGERLSDIEARIGSILQLSSVISAMRGIAAARSSEANRHLDSVRAYASTVAAAIGMALNLDSASRAVTGRDPQAQHLIIIALCAEQGFAGSFSRHVLDQVQQVQADYDRSKTELLLVGDRGLLSAGEQAIVPDWTAPMIVTTDQAASLANKIMDALFERLDGSLEDIHVTLVHAVPSASALPDVAVKRLVPFDFSRFPAVRSTEPPVVNLPSEVLLSRLAEEYIFAELGEAVMLSFAAENDARMRAMISAEENVSDTLEELTAASRRRRQAEITDEIGELSASRLAD